MFYDSKNPDFFKLGSLHLLHDATAFLHRKEDRYMFNFPKKSLCFKFDSIMA
jgi:hypothetical protein